MTSDTADTKVDVALSLVEDLRQRRILLTPAERQKEYDARSQESLAPLLAAFDRMNSAIQESQERQRVHLEQLDRRQAQLELWQTEARQEVEKHERQDQARYAQLAELTTTVQQLQSLQAEHLKRLVAQDELLSSVWRVVAVVDGLQRNLDQYQKVGDTVAASIERLVDNQNKSTESLLQRLEVSHAKALGGAFSELKLPAPQVSTEALAESLLRLVEQLKAYQSRPLPLLEARRGADNVLRIGEVTG